MSLLVGPEILNMYKGSREMSKRKHISLKGFPNMGDVEFRNNDINR